MFLDILNKILTIVFFMSVLNVVRHTYYFIQAWVKSSSESPQKYILSGSSLWVLSVSLAYILCAIVNGITL
jgi:hypothetical protein